MKINFFKKLVIRLIKSSYAHYSDEAKLSKEKSPSDPLELFSSWFELAKQVDPDFADAMTLSTSSSLNRPSNRLVLLKGYNSEGFVFYTNYGSRKSIELSDNPSACLVFWWKELYRQVRIEGPVKKISAAESDAYFQTRSRGSQIGAWASKQSQFISSRSELESALQNYTTQFNNKDVPRPPFWGGYRLEPESIEFWQGRADRLHDRLCYKKPADAAWIIERLAP